MNWWVISQTVTLTKKKLLCLIEILGLVLMHKLYFFADESVGTGLGVEPKVRLTTLLKAYWDYRDLRGGSLDNISFYFWDGNDEGAVVFEENIVVRFGFRQNRGA